MKHLITISILTWLLTCITLEPAIAAYPVDPTSDTGWPYSSESTVAQIQNRFNTARSNENTQLGTSTPMMALPTQVIWDGFSYNEKAFWLINREREDRGVTPLHSTEDNVVSVAQYYAEYLMDNDAFSHAADGKTPWDRLNTNSVINSCHEFLNVAENLAVLWGGWALPLERAIYMWMYDDSGSSWGHRHAILWYPYNDDSGTSGQEGFLGIGHASGAHQGWDNSDIIVMNVFDPCSTWIYVVPGDLTGDGSVDLKDLILALQIVTGSDNSPDMNGEVNHDSTIGMAEALYIMQQLTL